MRPPSTWILLALLTIGCDLGAEAQRPAEVDRAPAPRGPTTDPFASLSDCEVALAERGGRTDASPRIGSWNVRWFPDGSSGGPSDRATDVEHLGCVLAWLALDAVALQEVRLDGRGERAIGQLTRALDRRTGGRWSARFDDCPRDGRQHLAWLYDASRVTAGHPVQLDVLNPTGGCDHHLRPGLAIHLAFPDGPDLHAITVHLDSGTEVRDYGNRRAAIDALPAALPTLRPVDPDVLVIGDLNTMGTQRPRVTAAEELAALDQRLAALAPPMRRLPTPVGCTEFYRGRGSLLDHAVVSASMAEATDAVSEATGPCARYRCALPRGAEPASLAHLSDHCPIVVRLSPHDLD